MSTMQTLDYNLQEQYLLAHWRNPVWKLTNLHRHNNCNQNSHHNYQLGFQELLVIYDRFTVGCWTTALVYWIHYNCLYIYIFWLYSNAYYLYYKAVQHSHIFPFEERISLKHSTRVLYNYQQTSKSFMQNTGNSLSKHIAVKITS